MSTNSRLPGSLQEIASTRSASNAVQIVIADDDDLFRRLLCRVLSSQGYEVTSFSSGAAALDHFASGGYADIIVLDWRMPGMNGLEVLRSLRRSGNTTPVIFFTVLSEDIYEEAALYGGAVDFIDKSRRLSILVERLRLIAEGARRAPAAHGSPTRDALHLGRLELRFHSHRASWGGTPIGLTVTEFKILAQLALRAGGDVSSREIYDVVRGKNFAAGDGSDGYRTNVRTLIKQIRRKFRDVDPEFDHIHNSPGLGYRYHWTSA
jgi:two-component system, OmpR family, response regulator ChvI